MSSGLLSTCFDGCIGVIGKKAGRSLRSKIHAEEGTVPAKPASSFDVPFSPTESIKESCEGYLMESIGTVLERDMVQESEIIHYTMLFIK
ncbi:hypothetical protein DSO57_1026223 [Entomophthora muscae]|uniref:Uncharacterized protein n=1 Tax=Entomophthora muscae TaxID=34485 RepID=A0ACC2U0K0_9FUNG|nr:hypothetical protein DSO57_1026223 [Entomophthora muscae]